jgi:hypothetical protein
MLSDSLHYALISESIEAEFAERRRAATILLEVARSEAVGSLDEALASVEEKFGNGVIPEARALVAELGTH